MWTKWNAQVDSWPPAILQKSSINFIIIININIICFIVFFSTLYRKHFKLKLYYRELSWISSNKLSKISLSLAFLHFIRWNWVATEEIRIKERGNSIFKAIINTSLNLDSFITKQHSMESSSFEFWLRSLYTKLYGRSKCGEKRRPPVNCFQYTQLIHKVWPVCRVSNMMTLRIVSLIFN